VNQLIAATTVTLYNALRNPEDAMLRHIKDTLTGEEQQFFIDGYSKFLKVDPNEFVVSFDFAFESGSASLARTQ